jgi:DNA polymerase III subunit epsilon
MLPIITYLDLETTGATPLKDRITEIALVRYEQGVEVARWQTLVNPQTPIPSFIQQLTGITNDMVQDAPAFSEVADKLAAYLEGAVLAAHNVRFDHGFLKSEYRRLGQTLRQRVLCTVKLSRKLYPQHKGHGLDAIMYRHQLTTESRHRAMGDVELMIGFVNSAQNELGLDRVKEVAAELSKQPSLPSGIDHKDVDDIPETAGVYLFFGENELPIYIGKSINLRDRVMSHFSSDHASTREMQITQEIKRIEYIETAGELGALLLESRLVKERQPIYNRQLRRERQLCTWQISTDPNTVPQVKLINESDIEPNLLGQLFGTFRSKRKTLEALRNIADAHQLCPRILGLEFGKGRCFASQLKKCKGACNGFESLAIHHLRLQQALSAQKLKSWPFQNKIGIREHCQVSGKTEIHIFDQWCHLNTVDNEIDFNELVSSKTIFAFDHDTYKLLLKALNSNKHELIDLSKLNSEEFT